MQYVRNCYNIVNNFSGYTAKENRVKIAACVSELSASVTK
jgi:hypothetical protein